MAEALEFIDYHSPIGELLIAAKNKKIHFIIPKKNKELLQNYELKACKNNPCLNLAKNQLTEYFNGERQSFNLPLDLTSGTSFQQESWKTLMKIPYGKTIAYKKQAELQGDYRKARAVGSANGKNPLLIVIPCHRVISNDGSLGGYSAGLKLKKQLLKLENSH